MKAADKQSTLPRFVESPSTDRDQWRTVRLRDVAFHPDYGVTASATPDPVGPKFLRITDIGKPTVDWSRVPHCRCSAREKEEKQLRDGDLVVARIGATTGITYLYRSYEAPAVFASYLIRIRCRETLSPEFLYQFSQSPLYWNQVDAIKQGRLKEGINTEELKNLAIPFPPFPEQHRIATVLGIVDEAIAATDAVIIHGEQVRQAVLIAAFNRSLAVSGADRREKWQKIRLGDCGRWLGGLTPSMENPRYWEGGDLPWITPKDMKRSVIVDAEDHITETAVRETSLRILPPGSVIFVVRGMILAKRFPVAITAIPSTINQDMRGIIPNEKIDGFFLLCALQNSANDTLSSVKTATHGTKKLDSPELKDQQIVVPPIDTQRRIAKLISAIDDRLALERAERDRLVALKKGLMQVLLTGKVRVPPGVAEGVAPAHA